LDLVAEAPVGGDELIDGIVVAFEYPRHDTCLYRNTATAVRRAA